MTDILLIFANLILLIVAAAVFALHRRKRVPDDSAVFARLDALDKSQERTERIVREEIAKSREEHAKMSREQRQELSESFSSLGTFIGRSMTDAAASQKEQLAAFSERLGQFATSSGDRLDALRAETASGGKQLREEVVTTLKSLSETTAQTMKDLAAAERKQLEAFAAQIENLTRAMGEKLDSIRSDSTTSSKQLREEVVAALGAVNEATTRTMGELALSQRAQIETMSSSIGKLSETMEARMEVVRTTVEGKIEAMSAENAKQLDLMRQTVDEKLQGTLEKRLGESFKQVSERLEQVHKGLGEMQVLATGVGDLKKVLTNVKTRGTWGEVQLGALLEQVLTQDQFARNFAAKEGSERVEYAIKLPGQGTASDDMVWLPIDAKFPVEDYQRLVEAQEIAEIDSIEAARKQLEYRVKMCARDISDKYLNPPRTTDFAVLYLPIEGLFAEVSCRPGLLDTLQREHRVVVAGPTTLWSILNSLQMGFRTLAIQKRSSEVWGLLGAVKTEWAKYGDVLDAVQKKLQQASDTIDKAKVRSRAVGRRLRDVQELPAGEAAALLPAQALDDEADTGEEESAPAV